MSLTLLNLRLKQTCFITSSYQADRPDLTVNGPNPTQLISTHGRRYQYCLCVEVSTTSLSDYHNITKKESAESNVVNLLMVFCRV